MTMFEKRMLLTEGLWLGDETPEIIKKLEEKGPIIINDQLRIIGNKLRAYSPGNGFYNELLKKAYTDKSIILPTEVIQLNPTEDRLVRLAMLY